MTKFKLLLLWLAIAGLSLTTPLFTFAQKSELRWDLAVDDVLQIELQQRTGIVSQVDQRSRKSTNEMRLWLDWTVQQVDEGQFSIRQVINRIQLISRVPTEGGEQVTEVDTDNSDGPNPKGLAKRLTRLVKPLIGAEVTLQMSTRGEIESVQVPEESLAVLREAPSSMQLRNVFTQEGLTELFGRAAMVTPEQPVGVGDSWKSSRTIQNDLGSFEQIQTYALEAVDSDQGTTKSISLTSELIEKEAATTGGRLVGFSSSGSFVFDTEAGIFSRSTLKTTMQTTRQYREKNIESSVNSEVNITMQKR